MTEIQQAMNLVKQGRKSEARPILERLIRSDPHDVTAWIWYAATIDSAQKRVQLLEACLKQNPGDPQVTRALDALRLQPTPVRSAPSTNPTPQSFSPSPAKHEQPVEPASPQFDDAYSKSPSFSESMGWDAENQSATGNIPNIRIPANEKALAYLKSQGSFHEMIVPYSSDKVNQNRVHSDMMDRFSSMSSLPQNSKYVVHGFPALVHPKTGIICGFVVGTSVIHRLPENIIDEIIEKIPSNASRVNSADDSEISRLESNWVSTWSITEKLVLKTFEYYGKDPRNQAPIHLNPDEDLIRLRSPRSGFLDKLFPIGVLILICLVIIAVLYVLNNFEKLF